MVASVLADERLLRRAPEKIKVSPEHQASIVLITPHLTYIHPPYYEV